MIYYLLAIFSFCTLCQNFEAESIDLQPLSKLALSHVNEVQHNTKSIKDKIEKLNISFKTINTKAQSQILETSLINKILLNSQIESVVKNLTTSLIKQVQVKLKKNTTILTGFSKEIMNKILDDYLEYFEEGFLNRYEGFSRNNSKEVKKYRELKSKLKFTSSWVHAFIDLNVKEFNQLCSKIIAEAIELSIDEAYYLGQFTLQKTSKVAAFKVLESQKNQKQTPKKQTLKGAIKGLEEDILENASGAIDSLESDK